MSSPRRASNSPLRRPAHLQQRAQAMPVMPVAAVGPLPYDAQCPGAPRMYPIPLPQVPEYTMGLYTPPASPVPVNVVPLRRASTQSHSSSRRGMGMSMDVDRDADGPVPSLFPSEHEEVYSSSASATYTYVPSYPTGATPNELWLMRQHGQNGAQSYMPAPSSSVRISPSRPTAAPRPALRRANTLSAGAGAYDERRVRFSWGQGGKSGDGSEDDEEEGYRYPSGNGSRYGYAPPHQHQRQSHQQQRQGWGQGQGQGEWEGAGVGATVSKRAWGGRGGDDEDDEHEEESEEEKIYPPTRRRGR